MNKPFYKPQPLSKQLILYVVLISLAMTIVVVSVLLYAQYNYNLVKLDQKLNAIKSSTIPSLEKNLSEKNIQAVQSTIDTLIKLDEISFIAVHSFQAKDKKEIFTAQGSKQHDNNIMKYMFPISQNKEGSESDIGELIIYASLVDVHSTLQKKAAFIIVIHAINAFAMTALIVLLLRTMLLRHLETIARHTQSLQLHKGYNPLKLKRNKGNTNDELDRVVDTLNQMHLTLIDEQKRELKREKDRVFAEAKTTAKTEFLSHMSHEIRAPMHGILGLVELIEDDNLNAEQKRHIELIRSSGKSLIAIINDVLDLSKIEANKLNIVKRPFSLTKLVNECCALYSPLANKKNLSIIEMIDPQLPDTVIADPLRIKQVLLNLLSNAIKYTKQGKIELKVLQVPHQNPIKPEQMQIHFSVSDTGIGIQEGHTTRIFQAFEQGIQSEAAEGTGLGLSICKKLIDLMQGEMGLSSAYREGSDFWFTIPVNRVPNAEEPTIKINAKENKENTHDFSAIAQQKVLVVEDNPVNREVIESLLANLGIYPTLLENGSQAIQTIIQENKPYPIILMDCEMPIMDGFEASRRIRNHEKEFGLPAARIVSFSAYQSEDHQITCEDSGMDFSLTKPLVVRDLKKILIEIQDEILGRS